MALGATTLRLAWNTAGHNRAVLPFQPDVFELVVEHLHMDAGKSEGDATYEKPHRTKKETDCQRENSRPLKEVSWQRGG